MRKPKPHSPSITKVAEPTEAEIQKAAYHLWVEGGCLEGVELDNWLAAKELIRHHHGAVHAQPKHRPAASARAEQA
ncbi:MAG: DUF2934 domain-containing protein [Opitutaceae bacterium]|nr:DUF2934 domain-containing protein [Opitutaceae bacterium]